LASGYRTKPIFVHHLRIAATAKAGVSWALHRVLVDLLEVIAARVGDPMPHAAVLQSLALPGLVLGRRAGGAHRDHAHAHQHRRSDAPLAQLAEALGYDPGVLMASKAITRRTPRAKSAPSE
jgi:hypothetical protein